MSAVLSGLDILCRESFSALSKKRIGVLANQSAVNSSLQHIMTLLREAPNCEIVRLFAPEHGFAGTKQDMETVDDDACNTLEIVSLYGSSEEELHPKKEHFSDIDLLVVDLPDIGARYYTFAQTMAYCMKVCAETSTHVLVLDRPNPIDGVSIEGSSLEESCRSFCGYGPIPQRHGLTLGELAQVFNNGFRIGNEEITAINCELTVQKIEGWQREMYFDDTGLPWVIPSVNMPTLDTAIVYPGMCLFEATAMSEGRGTTRPFEFVGAPFIEADKWASEVFNQGIKLSGAILRPISFVPKFQKCADLNCNGVQLHVSDRKKFEPLRWALALIASANKINPNEFAWRTGSYEFISKVAAIDLLYGSKSFRKAIESQNTLESIEVEISDFSQEFATQRKPYLLY